MNSMLWSFAPADDVTLFYALKPPPHVADEIALRRDILCDAHRLRGRVMGAERLHITLACCHLGRDGLDAARASAIAVGEGLRYRAFPVSFDRTQSFNNGSGSYPFVLCGEHALEGVVDFRAVLRARMRRGGLSAPSGFTPHVTLVWADRIVAPYPTAPIHWQAEEVLLVESHVGLSRHRHVAQWKLH